MKTALVLGGGGARGAYEIGVWQALKELDIKPDIVTGTSVGAINGAAIVQDSFEMAVNLWEEISTPMVVDIGKPRNKGSQLKKLLQKFLNEDKIRESEIDFGMVALELPVLQSRHFFLDDIPKGQLLDYIVASASLFPAIRVADIDDTKFVDGGYFDNLPVGMALDRGAQRIIAVDLETSGMVQKEPLEEAPDLTLIKCRWDLGEVMVFDGKDTPRKIQLGYLDTMKAFDLYQGDYFAFSKGQMDKDILENAEMAGKVFRLDPEIVYTRKTFLKALIDGILDHKIDDKEEDRDIQDIIKSIKPVKEKTVTLAIAEHLKTNPQAKDSILAKPISLLFKEESLAADFLLKNGLI